MRTIDPTTITEYSHLVDWMKQNCLNEEIYLLFGEEMEKLIEETEKLEEAYKHTDGKFEMAFGDITTSDEVKLKGYRITFTLQDDREMTWLMVINDDNLIYEIRDTSEDTELTFTRTDGEDDDEGEEAVIQDEDPSEGEGAEPEGV